MKKIPKLKLVKSEPIVNPMSPPAKLGKAGTAAWQTIMSEYQIEDAGGVAMLAQLCAALDDISDYSQIIKRDGLMIRTKSGTRAHPLLKERLSLRGFVARTIQRLGLNVEAVKSVGRPPGRGYEPWEDTE